MRFRLREAAVYKLEYDDVNGQYNYAYIIGNNNSQFDGRNKVWDFLRMQKYKGKETLHKNWNDIVQKMPENGIKCTKLDGDLKVASFKEKDKYLNFTHSTSRKKAPTMGGYIRHHLDGIEENNDPENILGISTDGPANALHILLHDTRFESIDDITYGKYPVLIYNGKEYIQRNLIVRLEIIGEGSEE